MNLTHHEGSRWLDIHMNLSEALSLLYQLESLTADLRDRAIEENSDGGRGFIGLDLQQLGVKLMRGGSEGVLIEVPYSPAKGEDVQ